MTAKSIQGIIIYSLTILLLAFAPAAGGDFTETFTNTAHMDPAWTTAVWDTVSGTLTMPVPPIHIGSAATAGHAYAVEIWGDRAYVAAGTAGLEVFDITNPSAPFIIGTYDTPGEALDVSVDGDRAYIADGDSGLVILDVSDPSTPQLVSRFMTGGPAKGVACKSIFLAWVACGSAGLEIIRTHPLTNPVLEGSYDTPGDAEAVFYAGSRVTVADGSGGLALFDVSVPSSPSPVSSPSSGDAADVFTDGNYAYVADTVLGLQILQVTLAGTLYRGGCPTPGTAKGIFAAGTRVYIADGDAGLCVIDVSDPWIGAPAASRDTPGDACGVFVDGETAYVADGPAGLQVFSLRAPVAPTLVGAYNTPGESLGITVVGETAYVSDWDHGLRVIDVANPASPFEIGSYVPTWYTYATAVSGGYAYLANSYDGLTIVDVSLPPSFHYVGGGDTPGAAADIVVRGIASHTACGSGGYNLNPVIDPVWAGSGWACDTPEWGYGVDAAGSYAYIADYTAGLQVIDTDAEMGPEIVGNYDTPGRSMDVAVSGDHAYVADYEGGLQIIDVSDPAAPTLAGSHATGVYAFGVHVSGNYAFVATGKSLEVFDVTDPTSPVHLGGGPLTSDIGAAAFALGDFAYFAAGLGGLEIYRVFQSDAAGGVLVAQSLPIDDTEDTIGYGRLTTTQTDSVAWELSADGGAHWHPVTPGGDWTTLTPGSDLLWRALLTWSTPGVCPNVSEVTIEWLPEDASGVGDTAPSVKSVLHQNVPNPFNPSTMIRYELAAPSWVDLRVYDATGALVCVLVADDRPAGPHDVFWDGRNQNGARAASGVYFYRLNASGIEMTRKMVLLE